MLLICIFFSFTPLHIQHNIYENYFILINYFSIIAADYGLEEDLAHFYYKQLVMGMVKKKYIYIITNIKYLLELNYLYISKIKQN